MSPESVNVITGIKTLNAILGKKTQQKAAKLL
jgi:hypothetical protein